MIVFVLCFYLLTAIVYIIPFVLLAPSHLGLTQILVNIPAAVGCRLLCFAAHWYCAFVAPISNWHCPMSFPGLSWEGCLEVVGSLNICLDVVGY